MHSLHGDFKEIRIKLGIQKEPGPSVGLSYEKIRDGQLSLVEDNFLMNYVVPDFNSGKYGKIHLEVSDPDKIDFTIADLRSKAEVIYSKAPFSLLFLDHAGLVSPRKWVPSTTERLNEVVRDTKRLAMGFNRGMGMAVVVLFQINREGSKSAEKAVDKSEGTYNVGPYSLHNLSYANEAERSSDIVTASYVDNHLRAQNRVLFQCLKSRDQAPFTNFFARVEWSCRRILTSYEIPMANPSARQRDGGKDIASTMDEITGLI